MQHQAPKFKPGDLVNRGICGEPQMTVVGYAEGPTVTLVRVYWLDRRYARQEAEFPEAALHLVADDEFEIVSVGFPPGF